MEFFRSIYHLPLINCDPIGICRATLRFKVTFLYLGSAIIALSTMGVARGSPKEHRLRVDSTTITYEVPPPKKFLQSPQLTPVVGKGDLKGVFAAYYEKTFITDTALYEVAASLARTEDFSLHEQKFQKNGFLEVLRRDPALSVLLHHPGRMSISEETLGMNRWVVFRYYEKAQEELIETLLYARPLNREYVLIFRLNFWSYSKDKGIEWRRKRLALLTGIVESVRIAHQ